MLMIMLLGLGMTGVLGMLYITFAGPSSSKTLKRRLEAVRERHSESGMPAIANAQIRKLLSRQDSKVEGLISTLVPRPAVMRQRLEKTGPRSRLDVMRRSTRCSLQWFSGCCCCADRRSSCPCRSA